MEALSLKLLGMVSFCSLRVSRLAVLFHRMQRIEPNQTYKFKKRKKSNQLYVSTENLSMPPSPTPILPSFFTEHFCFSSWTTLAVVLPCPFLPRFHYISFGKIRHRHVYHSRACQMWVCCLFCCVVLLYCVPFHLFAII